MLLPQARGLLAEENMNEPMTCSVRFTRPFSEGSPPRPRSNRTVTDPAYDDPPDRAEDPGGEHDRGARGSRGGESAVNQGPEPIP